MRCFISEIVLNIEKLPSRVNDILPFFSLFPTETKRIKEFYLDLFKYFSTNPKFKGLVKQKYRWIVIQQTLFLNIKIINEKQSNWNTYMQLHAGMYSPKDN